MKKRPKPEKTDILNPEWTVEDFRRSGNALEVLPPELVETIRKRRQGQRGPQRSPVKAKVTIRLDQRVLEHFKATGRGWQTRINDVLKRLISERKAS
ncbi:MAG: BrnA antitoxin family protein [Thermodesulfobacteriota bacterium]